ncbi:hypothetical protein N7462_010214 [Penicillium macrosclerotiorum]|uniref:uncharacterized protein n=1 Tax=Penicillium macrosclerotiorum TaxID=303699 RepID=UPI0025468F15|nr:uncharacterized protein N7462_010214 [Penicillium macrosclerotiorum]KAJ5669144.1 hypothetical protein N7462_010214 [Penicillium macrosclerotiorum]
MINPQQMATNKPANANDEDLFDGMSNISMPIDQPTSMSYCVQRIRLGEICREISDSIPFLEIGPGDPHYEMIKHFDKRICEFAEGMPPFFSLDRDTHQLPDSDRHKSSGISIQRYIINSLLYTQRCRLHLPYLSRAASEPTYAYSRIACLEAARMIIRTEARLSAEKFPFVLTRFKFSGGLYCVCMAIIVLLMDLCQNKTMRPEDDRELRAETFQAFGILEEAQGHSPFAGKLLKSFHAIISRNKIPISTAENKLAGQPRTQSRSGRESTHNSTLTPVSTEAEMETTTIDASLPCFEDIWQTFDASVDPSTLFDWNALLSELDSPFLSI